MSCEVLLSESQTIHHQQFSGARGLRAWGSRPVAVESGAVFQEENTLQLTSLIFTMKPLVLPKAPLSPS